MERSEIIHSVGGILEHPLTSRIWNIGNRQNGITLDINQADFGHKCSKPTRLYIWPKIDIPHLPWPIENRRSVNVESGNSYWREATPAGLIDWFEIVLDRIKNVI